jgi:hypothetical protein
MLFRLTVVLVAYALSSMGLLFMYSIIAGELRKAEAPNALILLYLSAWALLVVMSAAWVFGVRLARIWPLLGTLSGVGSFLAVPLLGSHAGRSAPAIETLSFLLASLSLIGFQLFLVAPSVLLAMWLVWYHWRRGTDLQGVRDSKADGA